MRRNQEGALDLLLARRKVGTELNLQCAPGVRVTAMDQTWGSESRDRLGRKIHDGVDDEHGPSICQNSAL